MKRISKNIYVTVKHNGKINIEQEGNNINISIVEYKELCDYFNKIINKQFKDIIILK